MSDSVDLPIFIGPLSPHSAIEPCTDGSSIIDHCSNGMVYWTKKEGTCAEQQKVYLVANDASSHDKNCLSRFSTSVV